MCLNLVTESLLDKDLTRLSVCSQILTMYFNLTRYLPVTKNYEI